MDIDTSYNHDSLFKPILSSAMDTAMDVSSDSSNGDTSSGQTAPAPCPHIDAAFANEAARLSMLKKYKSAVAWAASAGEAASGALGRAAKRRKVSHSSLCSSLV